MSELSLGHVRLDREDGFDPQEPGVMLFHAIQQRLGEALWAGMEHTDDATARLYVDLAEPPEWELPPSDILRVTEGRGEYEQGNPALAVMVRHPEENLPRHQIGDLGLNKKQRHALEDEGFRTGDADEVIEPWREIELTAKLGEGLEARVTRCLVPSAIAACADGAAEAEVRLYDRIHTDSPGLLTLAEKVASLPILR
jgi:hypothetical protein